MNNTWSSLEKQFIRDNASTMKDKELAVKLSEITRRAISLQAVRKQRQKLGLSKICGRGRCELKCLNN